MAQADSRFTYLRRRSRMIFPRRYGCSKIPSVESQSILGPNRQQVYRCDGPTTPRKFTRLSRYFPAATTFQLAAVKNFLLHPRVRELNP